MYVKKVIGAVLVVVIAIAALFYFEGNRTVPDIDGSTQAAVVIGDASLTVDVADTLSEHMRGLSGRESLEPFDGLLFIFSESGYHGIWMKEMLFAIDIIWINEDMVVVDIKHNATPDTFPESFEPKEPARFVIETNAGYIESAGIKIGDTVNIPKELLPEYLR